MLEECLSDYPLTDNNLHDKTKIKIGIVGPCSSGKTTLITGLKEYGYAARHIAQEHSYVPDMWKRLASPNILIYLDVSYLVSMVRRPLNLTESEFDDQIKRLSHSKNNADFYLHTDLLSVTDVLKSVLNYLDTSHLDENDK
jgi:GTPase SAR1 family protein